MSERMDDLEEWGYEVIMGTRKGFRASSLRAVLLGLSGVFRGLVKARISLFRTRIKKDHYLGAMVVSIGNLTMGGTGKTPVVEMLARRLAQEGRRVAILSRGYKRKRPPLLRRFTAKLTGKVAESEMTQVVSNGAGETHGTSTIAGDEPFMLAKNLPPVAVLVDRDRVRAGRLAVGQLKCDTILLDDGLQYLRLRRRLDIVLVDRNTPFGNEYLIPRGTLREPPQHLRRASHIFLTKCDDRPTDEVIAKIQQFNKTASIIECRHRPVYLQNVYDPDDRQELAFLEGKRVGSISGIAVPESFEGILTRLGASLVSTRRFTDHHRYTESEIDECILRSDDLGAHCIVTTEKDAVRFPAFTKTLLPVYYLRVEIEILRGHAAFEECIARICAPQGMAPPMQIL